ncbi:MAG: cytochrome c oxidase accessory protein CcoG [Bacteroidia bacterium]|nr:cytochrome c oxidase accessory protein CcoG [Bacteroidia bacterium]MCZ2248420.1 cytochrome c oxidase accessory protein CcoG [Bacteroidia bacterium]
MDSNNNSKPDLDQSFRDSVSTVAKDGKRVWIFPLKPKGKFYDYRTWFSYFCLILLFGLPFVKIDGNPLLLLNIIERKFIIFGIVFWPQDFALFGLAMITFMVFIVLFTAVFGRLFCGWACPQTIFMEMVFRKIEYWIEGDMAYQKLLDKMPWNAEKIRKKTMKYFLFFLVSFIISNTFLAYIIGVDELYKIITEPVSQHIGGLTAIFLFTGVFYFVYSYMREQVCIVVCPYGRLQGVLLDRNSIVVAYDYMRGEQRAKFKKNQERTAGDCVDCNLCVKVCPTGIDIRNGTQMECINCTACIDACDNMMDAVNLPKGLIRYTSENQIEKKKPFKITSRIIVYSALLLLLLVGLISALLVRSDVETTILRTAGLMYQEQPNEKISNLYNYKVVNKTFNNKNLTFKLEDFDGEFRFIGQEQLTLKGQELKEGEFFLIVDKKNIKQRSTKIKIGVYENGKRIETIKTKFLGKSF